MCEWVDGLIRLCFARTLPSRDTSKTAAATPRPQPRQACMHVSYADCITSNCAPTDRPSSRRRGGWRPARRRCWASPPVKVSGGCVDHTVRLCPLAGPFHHSSTSNTRRGRSLIPRPPTTHPFSHSLAHPYPHPHPRPHNTNPTGALKHQPTIQTTQTPPAR